jgi:uncharacterized protein (TIGR02270 family)
MATSYRVFLVELYQEYLAEASFFYERRRNSIRDHTSTWTLLASLEYRLETHLDGLMVGGDLALDVCRKQTEDGDFGELYAAISIFCRQRRMDLVQTVLNSLNSEDVEKIEAAADAINHEAPAEWCDELVRAFKSGVPAGKLNVLARVLGWRRWESSSELSTALNRSERSCLPAILWALGRSRTVSRKSVPFELLNDRDPAVCFAASVALLRRGETQAIPFLLQKPSLPAWACIVVALAGGKSAAELLLAQAPASKPRADLLIALGLLGAPSAVPFLIAQLTVPELAPVAAMSLETITAAKLWENVFVPETIDDDELFDHEKQHHRTVSVAFRSDGKPFGGNERRLSLDPRKWNAWWSANSPKYDAFLCYRYGQRMSPRASFASLESEETPNRIRTLVTEELAIRYGCDVPFEMGMRVADQKQAIAKIRDWVDANVARFRPGTWYFNGNLAE